MMLHLAFVCVRYTADRYSRNRVILTKKKHAAARIIFCSFTSKGAFEISSYDFHMPKAFMLNYTDVPTKIRFI